MKVVTVVMLMTLMMCLYRGVGDAVGLAVELIEHEEAERQPGRGRMTLPMVGLTTMILLTVLTI